MSTPATAKLRVAPWLDAALVLARRTGYNLALLLERRLWIYLAGDAMFLFLGMVQAIEATNGSDLVSRLYPHVVVLPGLVLGLPAMSGVLALERRAGSLDLALAVPSTERYFRRRILPICVFLAVQGAVVMALATDGWELARALVQSTVLSFLLGALTLFWATRLKTSGAVMVASLATVALLSPWIFFSPVTRLGYGAPPMLFGIPLPVIVWSWKAAVQALAALILYLYARQRLRRPEVMLT